MSTPNVKRLVRAWHRGLYETTVDPADVPAMHDAMRAPGKPKDVSRFVKRKKPRK